MFLFILNLVSLYQILISCFCFKILTIYNISEANRLSTYSSLNLSYNKSGQFDGEGHRINYGYNLIICGFVIFYNVVYSLLFIGRLLIRYIILTLENVTFYETFKDKFNKFPWKNPFRK